MHEALNRVELARDEFKLSRELGKRCVVLVQAGLQLSDFLLDVQGHAT